MLVIFHVQLLSSGVLKHALSLVDSPHAHNSYVTRYKSASERGEGRSDRFTDVDLHWSSGCWPFSFRDGRLGLESECLMSWLTYLY